MFPISLAKVSPNTASEAYSKRGFSRLDKKDYENAIANFNEVIWLNPKDARA